MKNISTGGKLKPPTKTVYKKIYKKSSIGSHFLATDFNAGGCIKKTAFLQTSRIAKETSCCRRVNKRSGALTARFLSFTMGV